MISNNPLHNSHVNTCGAVKPKRQLYGKRLKGRKRQFPFLKIAFWQNKAEHQAIIDTLAYSKRCAYKVFLEGFYRFFQGSQKLSDLLRSRKVSSDIKYQNI